MLIRNSHNQIEHHHSSDDALLNGLLADVEEVLRADGRHFLPH